MQQAQTTFTIPTRGLGLHEFTAHVARWVAASGIETGLLTLFCRHTSASLLVNENAAPAVQRDLLRWLDRAAPESAGYEHDDEGPDDMPAHIRTMLTGVSLAVPVADGRLALGTWQGLYLAEHRRAPHRRQVVAHLLGE
ncbi:MAG: secondary thiamine-phosphate synthase enzyme YjbQ [Erythrobacter sp.]|nr:secondary thiamine-phosphate synthase enzyme YjbQ [Erythrobacter sp.]